MKDVATKSMTQSTIVRPHNCKPARRRKVYNGSVVTFDGFYPVKEEKTAVQFQEEKYGKGMRLFNPAPQKEGSRSKRYRCTVCGETITI